MTRTIKIVASDETRRGEGCGSAAAPQADKFAAGIDTDIFEADNLALGGERFWESFWKTQHTYGGVQAGQTLASVFGALADPVLERLLADVERLRVDHATLADGDKDDVLGMVMFLLSLERSDPLYNPFEHEGYDGALTRFATAAAAEMQRRR